MRPATIPTPPDGSCGVYILPDSGPTETIEFPMPGYDAADTLRESLRKVCRLASLASMKKLEVYTESLESFANFELPKLQTQFWRGLTYSMATSEYREQVQRILDTGCNYTSHVWAIMALVENNYIFVIDDSADCTCAAGTCSIIATDGAVKRFVTLEPLLDWGTVTPARDMHICFGKIQLFRRDGEKLDDPLWYGILRAQKRRHPARLTYCLRCLELIADMNGDAFLVDDVRESAFWKQLMCSAEFKSGQESAPASKSAPQPDSLLLDGVQDASSSSQPQSDLPLRPQKCGKHSNFTVWTDSTQCSEEKSGADNNFPGSTATFTNTSTAEGAKKAREFGITITTSQLAPISVYTSWSSTRGPTTTSTISSLDRLFISLSPKDIEASLKSPAAPVGRRPMSSNSRSFGQPLDGNSVVINKHINRVLKMDTHTKTPSPSPNPGPSPPVSRTPFKKTTSTPKMPSSQNSPQNSSSAPSHSPVFARRLPLTPTTVPSPFTFSSYASFLSTPPSYNQRICTCRQPARTNDVKIAQCSGKDCVVGWYHVECLEKRQKCQVRYGTMLCEGCRMEVAFRDMEKSEWPGGGEKKDGEGKDAGEAEEAMRVDEEMAQVEEKDTQMEQLGVEDFKPTVLGRMLGIAGVHAGPFPYGLGTPYQDSSSSFPLASIAPPPNLEHRLGTFLFLRHAQSRSEKLVEAYTKVRTFVERGEDEYEEDMEVHGKAEYEDEDECYDEEYEEYDEEEDGEYEEEEEHGSSQDHAGHEGDDEHESSAHGTGIN